MEHRGEGERETCPQVSMLDLFEHNLEKDHVSSQCGIFQRLDRVETNVRVDDQHVRSAGVQQWRRGSGRGSGRSGDRRAYLARRHPANEIVAQVVLTHDLEHGALFGALQEGRVPLHCGGGMNLLKKRLRTACRLPCGSAQRRPPPPESVYTFICLSSAVDSARNDCTQLSVTYAERRRFLAHNILMFMVCIFKAHTAHESSCSRQESAHA